MGFCKRCNSAGVLIFRNKSQYGASGIVDQYNYYYDLTELCIKCIPDYISLSMKFCKKIGDNCGQIKDSQAM